MASSPSIEITIKMEITHLKGENQLANEGVQVKQVESRPQRAHERNLDFLTASLTNYSAPNAISRNTLLLWIHKKTSP